MFRILSMALVFTMVSVGSAFAAASIGVFNSQTVALDSEPAKEAQKKLQSQFGGEKDQLEKLAKDLQKQGESLQAQSAALSQQAREEKQMDFLRKRRDFEEKSRTFAGKVENSENQIRQTMGRYIFQAAETVAKQRGFDLILDAATGSVMYATANLDVTRDMVSEVNKLWKAGGSKFDTPAAPAASKKK